MDIDGKEIDVITIKNSNHTPFMLTEDFHNKGEKHGRKLIAYHVYTRVNDSNTPIKENADVDKVEYLWRKRFGINLSVLDKLKLFLFRTNDWVHNDDYSNPYFYYKYDPLFVIKLGDDYPSSERKEFYNKLYIDPDKFNWNLYTITYNGVKIYESVCSYNDGGRELRTIPNAGIAYPKLYHDKSFSFYYYIKTDKDFYIDEIFKTTRVDKDRFSPMDEFLIYFKNKEEFKKFKESLNDKLISNAKYDRFVLMENPNLNEYENKQYIDAKKAQWLYKHEFSK